MTEGVEGALFVIVQMRVGRRTAGNLGEMPPEGASVERKVCRMNDAGPLKDLFGALVSTTGNGVPPNHAGAA